jgi:predicted dehydrogenase
MNNPVKNIILIGLGPHAKRIYYPLLEKYSSQREINLVAIVDLEGNESSVSKFLENRSLQPNHKLFVPRNLAYQESLDCNSMQLLDALVEEYKIDGVIVASEPKSHKAYLKWALGRNLHILGDKPITCPANSESAIDNARQIELDFLELKELYAKSHSNFIVQAQRRGHLGYIYIYKYLEEFIKEFQIPISYIDIAHADGVWVMPDEWERENHSYKYGTGKLMHSGYHFVDLLAWFLTLNQQLENRADEQNIFVQSFKPSDFANQLQSHHYQHLFQRDYSEHFSENKLEQLEGYGEQDIFMLSQLKRCSSVVTTASLKLQQNSFSRRAWSDLPSDTYKGNGRIRHECVNIQLSTLLNIQVHSYQSYQVGDKVVMDYGAGHINHFDILIFRNSGVTGGKTFEKIEIGKHLSENNYLSETFFSHNEMAREQLFLDFLNCYPSRSDFLDHACSSQLMSNLYECLALGRSGQIPYLSRSLQPAK